jgi:ABC-type uncharacterized transport system involved in gliding motility auxiliary subunit
MSNTLTKTGSWRTGLRRLAVFLAVVTAFNLACHYGLPAQIDLTRRGAFTLAPQTRNLLDSLQSPVEVILLATKTPSVAERNFHNAAVMFRDLLETCRRRQPLVQVRELDPQESAAGRQLQQQFSDVAPPCVLITYGSASSQGHEILQARDLAEFRAGNDRRLAAVDFVGEQALAAALARLTAGRKQALVYVATGHGELALDDADPESRRGLGLLAERLRELDCALRALDLAVEPRVPHDASLVLLAGGEQAWQESETEKLGNYLRQGGKALILMDLNFDPLERRPAPSGLEALLSEFGVAVGNDRVITRGFTGQIDVASPALPAAGDHPLVRSLPQSPLTLFECRSLYQSTGPWQLPTKIVRLLESHPAPRAWAEGDFGKGQPQPGGKNDADGPVPMAIAVERRGEGEAQPALVVVGDAEFVSNRVLSGPAGRVNSSFVLSSLNWLRGRRELLGDIPPRRQEGYRLAGTSDEQRGIVWKSSLILWSLIVTAGATVWTSRRRG